MARWYHGNGALRSQLPSQSGCPTNSGPKRPRNPNNPTNHDFWYPPRLGRMHVRICIYIYIYCTYVYTNISLYVHVCIHIYICIYIYVACVSLCIHVCMHVCMCACVHVCMCACVHVCMCACVHVCMCACQHVMSACLHAYVVMLLSYQKRSGSVGPPSMGPFRWISSDDSLQLRMLAPQRTQEASVRTRE